MQPEQRIKIESSKPKKIIIAWILTIILATAIFLMQLYLWSQFVQKVD